MSCSLDFQVSSATLLQAWLYAFEDLVPRLLWTGGQAPSGPLCEDLFPQALEAARLTRRSPLRYLKRSVGYFSASAAVFSDWLPLCVAGLEAQLQHHRVSQRGSRPGERRLLLYDCRGTGGEEGFAEERVQQLLQSLSLSLEMKSPVVSVL